MTDKEDREVLIPFSGLYESRHSLMLDGVCEDLFPDAKGRVCQSLVDLCYFDLNWAECQESYAKDYVDGFLQYAGLPGKFALMVSPREYNFGTDRVFADVPAGVMEALEVPPADMDRVCVEWFESCSGFMSYYSPAWREWGDMAEWDHNQMGARLVAWMESRDMDPNAIEGEVADALCDGSMDAYGDILLGADPADTVERALKIRDYLREREERRWAARRVAEIGEGGTK